MSRKNIVKIPERLPLKYDTAIRIEDNIGCVQDEAALRNTMESFLDETGITLSLITDTNDAWEDYYNSMEYYAYDMYVQRFPDESHWLIVYTTDNGKDFDDWHFEGMQGDDTDIILPEQITNIFNQSMTKYLMQGYSVDRALTKSLADIRAEKLMDIRFDKTGAAVITVITLFLVIHICITIRDPNKKYRKYTMIPDEVKKEDYCEYCGSAYWPGTVLECPNCGAPLKRHNQKRRKNG